MKLLFASLLFLGPTAYATQESYEACTFEGPCMIRVTERHTGKAVFLVTEKDVSLQYIWGDGGEFWLVSDTDYSMIKDAIPEGQRFTVPAKEPTSGRTLSEAQKKGGGTPQPQQPAGPLIGGSITVTTNIGGSGNCTDCHKGSHYDIHKKKLNDGAK